MPQEDFLGEVKWNTTSNGCGVERRDATRNTASIMITYQQLSLTCYSICKTSWRRVALFWKKLDDVRSAFEHGLCLRAAERLSISLVAGLRWRTSAKEFVSFVCSLCSNDDRPLLCVYHHLERLQKESKSSQSPQSWSTLRKRSRSASLRKNIKILRQETNVTKDRG